jgi:hypothetical protein
MSDIWVGVSASISASEVACERRVRPLLLPVLAHMTELTSIKSLRKKQSRDCSNLALDILINFNRSDGYRLTQLQGIERDHGPLRRATR